METQITLQPHARMTLLLAQAVANSGRSRRDVARGAGMHKDLLARTLNGTRGPTIDEALAILRAVDLAPEQTLALALTAGEDTAIDIMETELGRFVGDFFCQVPKTIMDQLGEQTAEVRSRWAPGAAQRIARLLSDHITQQARHDAALPGA
jgi:transcriptional regulator with XRE-family HTH domain